MTIVVLSCLVPSPDFHRDELRHRSRRTSSGNFRFAASTYIDVAVDNRGLNTSFDINTIASSFILRVGKRAVLYEVVASGTSEEGVSARRREHSAYQ